ncbi:MAG TPA: hypothetical protein VHO01_16435 [Jatrophihabitans sp.]|nr:hypothetical protein [Jatrophihabitans sp.]
MIQIAELPTPAADVPRDGHGKPLVIPITGGKPKAYTRTTTFIDTIEDKSTLATWGKNMVLRGVALDPSLLDGVADLDPKDSDDRKHLIAITEKALDVAGANDKREKGTHLHGLSELVDQGIPLPEGLPAADRLDMAGYAIATADMTFTHIEQFVVIPTFEVGGTPDRICNYSGPGPAGIPHIEGSFIFDLKTGSVEYGGLKMASQLAVYSRAFFYDFNMFPAPPRFASVEDMEKKKDSKEWKQWKATEVPAEEAVKAYTPIPPVNQNWGIILHLPSGESNPTLYWVDLEAGWEAAELSVDIRRMRSLSSRALQPFSSLVA